MRISDWSSDVCSSDLVGRREDLLVPAVVVLERAAVAAVAAAVDDLEKIVGEALAGGGGVVVLLDVVAAPDHVPLALERQPQARLGLVVQVGRGCGLGFRPGLGP